MVESDEKALVNEERQTETLCFVVFTLLLHPS
jgi:hypothetical protein